MAVSCGVTGETSRERKPGGHFSETRHDDEDNGSDEGVTDEERARASIGERFTRSNNETSSESTTNSCSNRVSLRLLHGKKRLRSKRGRGRAKKRTNHSNVTRLETAVQTSALGGLETSNVRAIVVMAKLLGVAVLLGVVAQT